MQHGRLIVYKCITEEKSDYCLLQTSDEYKRSRYIGASLSLRVQSCITLSTIGHNSRDSGISVLNTGIVRYRSLIPL